MDFSGFNWALITIIGGSLLAIVIAVAALRNRVSDDTKRKSEAGTRDLYKEEERARGGEGDNVY